QNDKAKAAYQKLLTIVKPGSQASNEVKALIAAIDRQQPKSPGKTPSVKASPKPAATKSPITKK
ncbi:MAG: hypothetical protein QOJ39_1424, partial [Candidatus Eremiobacteraeota bacterium]|nr:hypothetical protein [Candidatus Eremiobacteraeota bacterium]